MAPPSPSPPPPTAMAAAADADQLLLLQQQQQQQQQKEKEAQQRRLREAAAAAWEASIPASESQVDRLARLEALLQPGTTAAGAVDDPAAAAHTAASYTPSHPFPLLGTQPAPPTPSSARGGGVPPLAPPPANLVGAHRQRVERLLALIALEEEEEGEMPAAGGARNVVSVVAPGPDAVAGAAAVYARVLGEYAEGLGSVASEVSTALGSLDAVAAGHEHVSGKAESLHRTCEGLLAEQLALEQRRALLAGPMDFFNELERLGPLLGLPGSHAAAAGAGGPALAALLSPTNPGATAGASPSLRPGAIAGGGGAGGLLFVRAQPGSEEFVEALGRIDHAIAFFQSHPQYKDSNAYLARMRTLQARGLGLVKNQAIHLLEGAARAALAKKAFENLETSPIYLKFRGIAPRVRDLVGLITARAFPPVSSMEGNEEEEEMAHRQALGELVEEVKKCYTHKRWQLLKPVLRAHLEATATAANASDSRLESGPTQLVRTGAAVLTRLCQLESQLHASCFGSSNDDNEEEEEEEGTTALDASEGSSKNKKKGAGGGVAPRPHRAGSQQFWEDGSLFELLRGLCLLLHELVRPLVIHEGDLDRLCSLINVVREEILEGQAPLRGESGVALEGVLDRIAKDAQERLIYAAERVLRVDVEGFRPQPADLEYPAKLERYWRQRLGGGEAESTSPAASSSSSSSSSALQPLYATWFPTLHVTLTLLSKIYRAVEIHVFQDMAQQALSSCNESLLAAARLIREQQQQGGGELDADMFLVKHLLILREQLVPFDVEFAAVERRLDFKSTRGALTKFFVDTRKLFRVGTDNALLSLAVDAVPTVNEEEVDSKRQLEDALKKACNAFIQHGADHLAAPLSSLLSKARAFVAPSSDTTTSAPSTAPAGTVPTPDEASLKRLMEQDFMRPERLEASLLEAHERLAASTPELLERMALYLDHNSATRAILFKPVRLRVLHVLSQLKELLQLALTYSNTATPQNTLPPQIDGVLTAMRASLTRALDGTGGDLDASAASSSTTSSLSSTGGAAGGGGGASASASVASSR